MVPGKAAKPWTLQGHRAEQDEHWLSRAGGGQLAKRQGKGDILAHPAKGVAGREGGCRVTPCLPCPTVALARSALGAWGQSELHVLCRQLQATSPASGKKAPGSASPAGAGGSGKGWGTPRTLPVPPCPAAMVLHPWPHTLVPAEPGKLHAGKVRVSSGGFGSLWTPLLTAPLLPTARQARGSPQRPPCHAFLP